MKPHASREDMIKKFREEGWSFFEQKDGDDATQPKLSAAKEKEKRMAAIAAMLEAEVPEFGELLDYFADQTLHKTRSYYGLTSEQVALTAMYDQGQDDVIRGIYRLIAKGCEG
jgi:hypothetical protein